MLWWKSQCIKPYIFDYRIRVNLWKFKVLILFKNTGIYWQNVSISFVCIYIPIISVCMLWSDPFILIWSIQKLLLATVFYIQNFSRLLASHFFFFFWPWSIVRSKFYKVTQYIYVYNQNKSFTKHSLALPLCHVFW